MSEIYIFSATKAIIKLVVALSMLTVFSFLSLTKGIEEIGRVTAK
jgi:hypothetical protein